MEDSVAVAAPGTPGPPLTNGIGTGICSSEPLAAWMVSIAVPEVVVVPVVAGAAGRSPAAEPAAAAVAAGAPKGNTQGIGATTTGRPVATSKAGSRGRRCRNADTPSSPSLVLPPAAAVVPPRAVSAAVPVVVALLLAGDAAAAAAAPRADEDEDVLPPPPSLLRLPVPAPALPPPCCCCCRSFLSFASPLFAPRSTSDGMPSSLSLPLLRLFLLLLPAPPPAPRRPPVPVLVPAGEVAAVSLAAAGPAALLVPPL